MRNDELDAMVNGQILLSRVVSYDLDSLSVLCVGVGVGVCTVLAWLLVTRSLSPCVCFCSVVCVGRFRLSSCLFAVSVD